jgi:hypothetical protein
LTVPNALGYNPNYYSTSNTSVNTCGCENHYGSNRSLNTYQNKNNQQYSSTPTLAIQDSNTYNNTQGYYVTEPSASPSNSEQHLTPNYSTAQNIHSVNGSSTSLNQEVSPSPDQTQQPRNASNPPTTYYTTPVADSAKPIENDLKQNNSSYYTTVSDSEPESTTYQGKTSNKVPTIYVVPPKNDINSLPTAPPEPDIDSSSDSDDKPNTSYSYPASYNTQTGNAENNKLYPTLHQDQVNLNPPTNNSAVNALISPFSKLSKLGKSLTKSKPDITDNNNDQIVNSSVDNNNESCLNGDCGRIYPSGFDPNKDKRNVCN